ncbi:TadE/TadG family type IV pilus assembly protein [Streptomyces radicis]|uniref:Pilus assembly protein n=1 Tax=Streptomyces radicis TaxID=1750517 RepID=A0A3A9WGY8_9ACTN|nr:TadE/TadG family type IV pilus assembly protein [Streptomyces radicis]RKN11573.1 pilus assembly protein [Streptomyces radicis]RKN26409.1 pilus assembly protein [Streptomyces radicis]
MNDPGDRGAASTQLVVLTPVLMLLTLLSVQCALAWHAQHIAQAAASRALADTRAAQGTKTTGAATARATLDAAGGRVLHDPTVRVHRTPTSASVDIHGNVLPVVPGLDLTVRGHAEGPVERFLTPGDEATDG